MILISTVIKTNNTISAARTAIFCASAFIITTVTVCSLWLQLILTVAFRKYSNLLLKAIVQHFAKYSYLLSCRELDEKTDTTLVSVF